MQPSNDVNPFLEVNEQHSHHTQPADLYINPFGDDAAAQKDVSAGTYTNPFLDLPQSANAHVNPFTDAPLPAAAENCQPYVNPFADSHTDAAMSSVGYVNPFEDPTLHQQGASAGHSPKPEVPQGTTEAHAIVDDSLMHHHSNPFLDPQKNTAEPDASNAEHITDKPMFDASPTASSSPAQDTHYNPFEDSPEPADKQSATAQAAATSAQHRQSVLPTADSELPPFTLADLNATTSDMAALSNQPSLTGTQNASITAHSAQVVEINPFLDGATEHISPTPVTAATAAAVHQQHPSSPRAQADAANAETQHADSNPFMQHSSDQEFASTAAQPAAVDRQSQSEAAAAYHVASPAQEPTFGRVSTDQRSDSQHSAFSNHHPASVSTSSSQAQLPYHHTYSSNPAQVTADRFYSAVLSQQDSGDFADFHSADAGDDDMGSPRAGPAPNQATHQEAQGQPAHSVASVASQWPNNNFADFLNSAKTGSPSEHRPASASQAAATHTSESLTTPQHQDQDAATLPEQTAAPADSPQQAKIADSAAQTTATASSSQPSLDAASADMCDVTAPATDSTPAASAQVPEPTPAHSSEGTLNDSVANDTDPVASSSTSAPSAASTAGHSTAQHAQQDTPEHHKKQNIAEPARSHEPDHEHQRADNGFADFAEAAAPAPPAGTTAVEAALPSQASLEQELADDGFAAFPQAPTPVTTGTVTQETVAPSQAPENGDNVDDGFASFAEAPRPASTSISAVADPLPSQASMDEELVDDSFADFTDAPPAIGTEAQEKVMPYQAPNSDGISDTERPWSVSTSTPAVQDMLPSQAALDDELVNDSFVDFRDAPAPAMVSTAVPNNGLPTQEAVNEGIPVATSAKDAEVHANQSHAQPAVAPSDDWGSGGDDFGDFNDAAEGADDDGFGAFNEAGQQSTAETTVSSPVADTQQQQQQQPSNQQQQEAKSVAGTKSPASTLSCLLDAEPMQVPSMVQQLLKPFAAPFSIPQQQANAPSQVKGNPKGQYDSRALMKYHLRLIQGLPAELVLPTAGLLGQPLPGGPCPMAQSLRRPQGRGGSWQGSRGDKRLLARLGLTQAGEQDKQDAQARALNAKHRWRQHSTNAGPDTACTAALSIFASDTPTRATEAQGSLFGAASAHLDLDHFA